MKTRSVLLMALMNMLIFISCKKEAADLKITFTQVEGIANSNGEFTITGHINSGAPLDEVTLTKEGETSFYLIDEATAKNKIDYDFSYLIKGITTNTYILVNVYNEDDIKTTQRFLIKKPD